MNHNSLPSACPDCEGVDRREFLKTSILTGAAVAASSVLPQILVVDSLQASPVKAAAKAASSESLVATLYKAFPNPSARRWLSNSTIPFDLRSTPTGKSRRKRSVSFSRQTSRP